MRQKLGGALVLVGLLAMAGIEPGEVLWPYIAVMAAALAAVAVGAKMGGWWLKKIGGYHGVSFD